jgi:hypothetical protein
VDLADQDYIYLISFLPKEILTDCLDVAHSLVVNIRLDPGSLAQCPEQFRIWHH